MKGQVYKAESSVYEVKCENKFYICTAKGILKKQKTTVVVGDFVEFDGKTINSVSERKNCFLRPSVANIDTVVIMVSPEPKPDFYLIDKLLINSFYNNVEVIIAVNKSDLDDNIYSEIVSQYSSCGVKILSISVKNAYGLEELKKQLKNRLTVLAGQSAAGKTSLVNSIIGLSLKTGELSKKVLRGKHTTTFSKIYEKDNINIVDTPGFAVIDAGVKTEELPWLYPDYSLLSDKCKFRGCTHINEPDCEVKKSVEKNILSKKRYLRYKEIFNEISERRDFYEKN